MPEAVVETIKLTQRHFIDIMQKYKYNSLPAHLPQHSRREFGVSLTSAEAQEFIERGYRVFGDEEGPYLVVRIPFDHSWPTVWNKEDVDVTFSPIKWELTYTSGIICWLTHIV